MGQWTLNVGNMKVDFMTTSSGVLGVKFNNSKKKGQRKVFVPGLTDKEIPKFNKKHPQENFYDTRYGSEHKTSEEINRKYFEKETPEVFIDKDTMNKQYPLTKEAKAISKQPITKLNLKNVALSSGYYLLPNKNYDNIQKYKKLIDYLGSDFIITSPIRLRVASVKDHNYAIFVDKSENAVVMVEVLVKAGYQPEPEV